MVEDISEYRHCAASEVKTQQSDIRRTTPPDYSRKGSAIRRSCLISCNVSPSSEGCGCNDRLKFESPWKKVLSITVVASMSGLF